MRGITPLPRKTLSASVKSKVLNICQLRTIHSHKMAQSPHQSNRREQDRGTLRGNTGYGPSFVTHNLGKIKSSISRGGVRRDCLCCGEVKKEDFVCAEDKFAGGGILRAGAGGRGRGREAKFKHHSPVLHAERTA